MRPAHLSAGPFLPKSVHLLRRIWGRVGLGDWYLMKYDHDRKMETKRMAALVGVCPISLEQATKMALSSVGGTAFEVKLREVDQQLVWKVKLVVDGQRCKVMIDANSGRVMKAKAETAVSEPVNRDHLPSRAIEPGIEL